MAKTTRFNQWILLFFMLGCATLVFASDAFARPHGRSTYHPPRYASIIMDAQTGRVLQQSSADAAVHPASLTKMMTLFLAFEAMDRGRLYEDKYLDVTRNAVNQPPSKLGLKVGERITVKQAIKALVTRSANDVATAMGETIGGSEANFARMMTARAKSLGMKNTVFYNASGLPNPAQKTTARDMAILARALMQYFPHYYSYFNTRSFVYKGQTITTHNHLIHSCPGMDGLKTGFINSSGFNLVASAVRNNRRLIVGVFGGRSAPTRDRHVADLFNRGFAMLKRDKQSTQFASVTPAKPVVALASKDNISGAVDVTTTTTKTTVNIVPTTKPAPVASTASAPVTTTTVTKIAAIEPAAAPALATATATTTTMTKTAISDRPAPQQRTTIDRNWTPDGGNVRTLQAPGGPQVMVDNNAGTARYQTVNYQPSNSGGWGIQVGAYGNAALGQQALQIAQQRLGGLTGSARAVVIPAVTGQGTVYRARILGLSADAASRACQQLPDCMAFTVR